MLAKQEGVTDRRQQARDSGEQSFVPLPHEIPVRLIYGNVFVDGKERVVLRADPYGWNKKVAKALGFDGGSARQATAQSGDIGP